jgi:hypothetical protein
VGCPGKPNSRVLRALLADDEILNNYSTKLMAAVQDTVYNTKMLDNLKHGHVEETKQLAHKLVSYIVDENFKKVGLDWIADDVVSSVAHRMQNVCHAEFIKFI